MNVLIFIVSGLLLALLFLLLKRTSKVWAPGETAQKASKKALPAMELALWIIYAFWGVHVLFGDHVFFDMIIGVMIIFLLAALAWFVFRDFLAGVLIRAEKALEPGQTIRTASAAGKIRRLGSLSLELVNDDGELVRIPYARLNQELITLPPQQDDNLPHHIELAVPAGVSPSGMQKKVHAQLLSMPWLIAPAPEVKVMKGEGGQTALHITYYTHMRSQAHLVEERIREDLAGIATAPGPL